MPTSLNTSAIQDALGIKGGDPIPFLPTVQIADFSDTAVGEFVEARGIGGGLIQNTVAGTTHASAYFEARAPGGAILTDVRIEVIDGGSNGTFDNAILRGALFLDILTTRPAGMVAGAKFDVGSQSTNSLFFGEPDSTRALSGIMLTAQENNGDHFFWQIQPGTRWLIPDGSGVLVQLNMDANAGGVNGIITTFTWRELAGLGAR